MAEDNSNTTTAASFGQRVRDLKPSTAATAKKRRSSLIRRDRADFDFRLPRLPKAAWLSLVIVPAPFLVPFFWPGPHARSPSAFEAAAEARPAPFLSVVPVKAADTEMDAAIRRARAGLAGFLERMDDPAPGERGFALKVALPDEQGALEHIWTTNVTRAGAKFQARVANAPVAVRGIKAGSVIEFEEAQVSDWMFRRDGRIVGNETIYPLLKSMPAAQAAQYRAMLAAK